MNGSSAAPALLKAASAPHWRIGGWLYHHARAKLRRDPVVAALQGFFAQLYYRALADWQRLLNERQFNTEALPMSAGTPFANAPLITRPR